MTHSNTLRSSNRSPATACWTQATCAPTPPRTPGCSLPIEVSYIDQPNALSSPASNVGSEDDAWHSSHMASTRQRVWTLCSSSITGMCTASMDHTCTCTFAAFEEHHCFVFRRMPSAFWKSCNSAPISLCVCRHSPSPKRFCRSNEAQSRLAIAGAHCCVLPRAMCQDALRPSMRRC